MAHRTELVSQISMTLARVGCMHTIIAPAPTVAAVLSEHRRELNRVWYNPHSQIAVVAVDTLIARGDKYKTFAEQCTLWIIDEAAHVLAHNKWGRCAALFANAAGIGFTATPKRADGKGLSRESHGVFDAIVQGPSVAQLMAMGYLSKYRILSRPSDLSVDDLKATAGGDFNNQVMAMRAHESHIVGDVVTHYLRHSPGKQGITFATDVETAQHLAEQFRAQGVAAECVSARTNDSERARVIRAFRAGDLRQLTNCDLFGEGFDVPGVEVVSLARPTMSLSLFLQQCGRALRPAEGKDRALIIDHVGNWQRHGLPDSPRRWSLEPRLSRGERDKDPDVIAVTACLACFEVFRRADLPTCPHCGHRHEPAARRRPEQVDGDLLELDADVLEALREAVELPSPASVANKVGYKAGVIAAKAAERHAIERIEAQARLRDALAVWAGVRKAAGRTDSQSYREFFLTFGVDVLTAQTLTRREMDDLAARLKNG